MSRAWTFIIQVTVTVSVLSLCVEAIAFEPPEGRSVVVSCILTESEVQTLELYYTSDVGLVRCEIVEDAAVSLSYNGRKCLLKSHLWIFPKNKGRWSDYQKYVATSHFCADAFNRTAIYVRDLRCFSNDLRQMAERTVCIVSSQAWRSSAASRLRQNRHP